MNDNDRPQYVLAQPIIAVAKAWAWFVSLFSPTPRQKEHEDDGPDSKR